MSTVGRSAYQAALVALFVSVLPLSAQVTGRLTGSLAYASGDAVELRDVELVPYVKSSTPA